MAKLFITGANEYVGRFLIEKALLKEHSVTLIHTQALLGLGDVSTHVRDTAQAQDYIELLQGHDLIIHLDPRFAAMTGIIAAAKQTGITRILFLSRLGARPQSPVASFACYHESEKLLRDSGLQWSIFKPSLIYGPGEPRLSHLVKWLENSPLIPYVNGWGMLQPVDVYDLVEFMLGAATNPETAGHNFEIGGTERVSMGQLIDLFLDLMGKHRLKWPWFTTYAQWLSRRFSKLPFPLWGTLEDVLMHNEQLICNMRGLPYQFKIQLSPLREGLKKYYL